MPEFLQHLLKNPALAGQTHRQQLEDLVHTYPACSVFRLMLAKSVEDTDRETAEKAIRTAAVYAASREVLYKLIHQPELITKPKTAQFYNFSFSETADQSPVFIEEKLKDEASIFAETYPVEVLNTAFIHPKPAEPTIAEVVYAEEISFKDVTDAAYIEPKSAEIEDDEVAFVEDVPAEEITDASFIEPKSAEIEDDEVAFVEDIPAEEITDASFSHEISEETIAAENDLRVEDINQTFVNEANNELIFTAEPTILTSEENPQPQKTASQEIDEEVYDEIMAIEDIDFRAIKTVSLVLHPPKPVETVPETPLEITPDVAAPEITSAEKPLAVQDEAEKAMLSNIASIDYFTFNHKFGQNKTADPEENISENIEDLLNTDLVEIRSPENTAANEAETVSKYHDDKMPYTFMWWLDRTRKEHAGTYQPYTKNVQKNQPLSVGPELNQQYIESIFHTEAPLKVPENILPPMEELPVKKKEKQLIERFIIEEPHIHPPSMDKLDTENKAKKSSEDGDIFVTETLAKVYLDQMLYHKALDTYKKLVLKFPEKSVYFATQITEIEKKIN